MASSLASPSRGRFELELPARHPLSVAENGVTPNFELQDSPLGADRGSLMTTPKPTLPKIDVASSHLAKRKSINEGSKRPTSPHVTIATPTSARHHHAYGSASPFDVHERRSSMPDSAHDTSSSSKARSSSSNRTPARQSSLNKGTHMSRNATEMATGRATPQLSSSSASTAAAAAAMSYVGIRPDSASAVSRRHVVSPEDASEGHFPAVFGDEDDDERFKGHGARRQSSIPSGRWTPTILSGLIKNASSPVQSFNSSAGKQSTSRGQPVQDEQSAVQGRKTPARYRPAEEAEGPRLGVQQTNHASISPHFQHSQDSHPLSHTHTLSNSTASNSSHSIHMHSSPRFTSHSRHSSIHPHIPSTSALQPSPILGSSSGNTATSSPLIVPQARRGAINLRPACRKKQAAIARRRRAAAESAAQASKRPLREQIVAVLAFLVRAFRCPIETAHACRMYFYETAASIDRSFRDPATGQRVWRPSWLGAYIPLLIWLVVSLSSTFTVLIWHTKVFRALDRLSAYLQEQGMTGRLILGGLIFITTFPPLPLYSTLIILCGFSFGLLQGFLISYIAALSGAIVVFLLSRSLLKGWMVELLNKSGGLKRVVRAIEKRPKLLFLVRLAPYPYNLMNTLLASSPTLTLRTYTLCTALALPKLLVHCALGTSIKNFAAYNGAGADPQAPIGDSSGNTSAGQAPSLIGSDSSVNDASSSQTAERIKQLFGFLGVGLCVGIFLYLFSVARKAVDEELDDEEGLGEEYDLMLSEEDESDDMEEVKGGGEGSELDDDSLNIARGSSDSAKESSTPSLIGSLQGGNSSHMRSIRDGEDRLFSSSDSTLADGSLRSCDQYGSSAEETGGALSSASRREGRAHQINFFAPRLFNSSTDSNPYHTQQQQHPPYCSLSSQRSPRHHESQTSLADSIVEMERHAMEMEQEPLFLYSHSQKGLNGSPYAD